MGLKKNSLVTLKIGLIIQSSHIKTKNLSKFYSQIQIHTVFKGSTISKNSMFELPCEDVRGKVDDLIAGLVGLESTRESMHIKQYYISAKNKKIVHKHPVIS